MHKHLIGIISAAALAVFTVGAQAQSLDLDAQHHNYDNPKPLTTSVPDVGSSALLLGAGVSGLASAKRLLKRKS